MQKYYRKRQKIFSVLFLCTILFPLSSHSATFSISSDFGLTATTETQALDGGSTVQTVDSVIGGDELVTSFPEEQFGSSPSDTDPSDTDPSVMGLSRSGGVGITMIISTHIKVYQLPLSYLVKPNFKIGVTIPYVQKNLKGRFNGEDLTDSGLGDVSANGKYRLGREDKLRSITSFYIKFPTGNQKQFAGGKERLALGTGSYDWIINEALSMKRSTMRYLFNLSYRFNGKSDYTEESTIGSTTGMFTFENKKGNVVRGYVGAEWAALWKLKLYGKLAGMFVSAGEEKYNNDTRSIDVDRTMDDALIAWDIIPGVKYQFSNTGSFRLGAIIPASTTYDPDVTDQKTREVIVDIGFDFIW